MNIFLNFISWTFHFLGVKNFLVLEAKDYIGGRLREEVWHGKTIAIGAGKSKSKHVLLCLQESMEQGIFFVNNQTKNKLKIQQLQ